MPLSSIPHIYADALLIMTSHSMGILPELLDASLCAPPDELLCLIEQVTYTE